MLSYCIEKVLVVQGLQRWFQWNDTRNCSMSHSASSRQLWDRLVTAQSRAHPWLCRTSWQSRWRSLEESWILQRGHARAVARRENSVLEQVFRQDLWHMGAQGQFLKDSPLLRRTHAGAVLWELHTVGRAHKGESWDPVGRCILENGILWEGLHVGAWAQCEKERLAYTKRSELTITTITYSCGLLRAREKTLNSEFEPGKNWRCDKSVSSFGFALSLSVLPCQ